MTYVNPRAPIVEVSTSKGFKVREKAAAARIGYHERAEHDPDLAEKRRVRAEHMAALQAARDAARAEEERHVPVRPSAAMIREGHMHPTRLAAIETFLAAIDAPADPRAELPDDVLARVEAIVVAMKADADLIVPRGRGRPRSV